MKKSTILFILFVATTTTLCAQALRKTEKINSDQVPVAIREAFESDFGKIPDDGYWTSNYIVERVGTRTAAKPLFYTFHKKNKAEKIEVRYTAEGKLDFVKGLEKTGNNT